MGAAIHINETERSGNLVIYFEVVVYYRVNGLDNW